MQSKSKAFPNGLGNTSDQLGRNIMDHHLGVGAQATTDDFKENYFTGRRNNGIYIPRFRGVVYKLRKFFKNHVTVFIWGNFNIQKLRLIVAFFLLVDIFILKLNSQKIFKDDELVGMIDPILATDDKNQDGFIDYPEFVLAQQAAQSRGGSP